ncbi:MAG: ComEC/Rec2 family competence protein [Bacteroidaceae bacterium]|nr:ComEC/Rec2 family competence protein [Bacteroidaceae bacterium]
MTIRQPVIWATLLYITGILLGNVFSSILFLYLSAGLLGAATLLRKKAHVADVLLFAFWITLGMGRMATDSPRQENGLYKVISREAQERNRLLAERLDSTGLDEQALAVSSALLLGQKEGLSREMRRNYAQAGASHLLALSGMHLGILYGLMYILLIRRIRYSDWKWFFLPPILLTVWGYAFIAGMPVSLVRASIMLTLATIAALAQADTPPLHILALSALVILLFTPAALMQAGFQLSFISVFFILVLYRPVRERLGIRNKVADLLLLSVVAQLGTAPLSIWYFHSLPLLGALVSIVLIPLTTIIIYLGLLLLAVPVGCVAGLLNAAIALQDWIVRTAGSIPHSTITDLYPAWWQVLLAYMLLLCIIARSRLQWSGEDFSL